MRLISLFTASLLCLLTSLNPLFAAGMAERAALVAPEILPAALPSTNFSMEETGTAPILNDAEKSSVVEINQTVLSPSPLVGEGRGEGKIISSRLATAQTLKKIKSRLPKKNFSTVAGLGALSRICDGSKINMSGSILEPKEGGGEGILSKLSKPPQVIKTIGAGAGWSEAGEILAPNGVFVDAQGHIYVVDAARNSVQIFDPSGKYLHTLGTNERVRHMTDWQRTAGNEGFNSPVTGFVDSKGLTYVSDFHNHRIQIFDPSWKYLRTLGSGKNTSTSGNEGFRYPQGVFVDPNGLIYVADYGNHRIQIFDSSLKYLRTIEKWASGNEKFISPYGVFVDFQGLIYVADAGNQRVQIFDPAGKYLRTIETIGPATYSYGNKEVPWGAFVDFQGRIYVVSGKDSYRFQIFDSFGKRLRTFEIVRNTSHEEVYYQWIGIFVDPNGLIYVADIFNRHIQVIQSFDELHPTNNKSLEEAERFLSQKATIPPTPQIDAEKKEKSETAAEHFKIDWGNTR